MTLLFQSLYDGVDDLRHNKADRTQVEVEVREVSCASRVLPECIVSSSSLFLKK